MKPLHNGHQLVRCQRITANSRSVLWSLNNYNAIIKCEKESFVGRNHTNINALVFLASSTVDRQPDTLQAGLCPRRIRDSSGLRVVWSCRSLTWVLIRICPLPALFLVSRASLRRVIRAPTAPHTLLHSSMLSLSHTHTHTRVYLNCRSGVTLACTASLFWSWNLFICSPVVFCSERIWPAFNSNCFHRLVLLGSWPAPCISFHIESWLLSNIYSVVYWWSGKLHFLCLILLLSF